MNAKIIMENLESDIGIPCVRLFWDENLYGIKPNRFIVWKFSGFSEIIDSDNEREIVTKDYAISYYSKNLEDVEMEVNEILRTLNEKSVKAIELPFEDYEKDTRYSHREIELRISE